MELAGAEQEPVLMHLQESPPLHAALRKRKHDGLTDEFTEETKAAAPRELRFTGSGVYDEPVMHGAPPAADRAISKKAKPPRMGHVLVKTLKGSTVRVEFPGTSISGNELKQKLEEAVGVSAADLKLMCGSQFVDEYDRVTSATRLFMIMQVGATPTHT